VIEYCAVKDYFVDCRERVRCNWSYGLVSFGLGLGLEPCGLVNITALRVAGVTAGLAEVNGSLPPGL